jgi:Tol biopolymer transport system component
LTGRTGAAVGLVLAAALLFVSIGIGLQVPAETRLDPFGSGASLDYRALRFGSFAPLRGEFIEKQLGSVIGTPARGAAVRKQFVPQGLEGVAEPVVVAHPFTNDAFANAYPISTVPFTARTNTATATRQAGEPGSCGGLGTGGGTAWYRYRSRNRLGLIANTFGSNYGTALSVFSGTTRRDLVRIGCDSNSSGFSQLAFPARPNVTYWFQITNRSGAGNLVFNLTLQGVATLASLSSSGAQGDADSVIPSISPGGESIAFYSGSTTFGEATEDPLCFPTPYLDLCRPSLYVRDRRDHVVKRVDRAPPTNPIQEYAPNPLRAERITITGSVSEGGRYIAFWSTTSTFVADDTNESYDVFVRDQVTKSVERMSESSSDEPGNANSYEAALSVDGRYAAFASASTNLVDGDTNGVPDVFVHDRLTDRTFRVSVNSTGEQANMGVSQAFPLETGSRLISMSANGRYVMFRSVASNLVAGDTNEAADVFVHDIRTRKTSRVNVSSSEAQANADTRHPVGLPQWNVSDDGRYVFFNSDASNLVANDTNGAEDIFVRDTVRGKTRRVSVSSSGGEAEFGVGDRDVAALAGNYIANASVVPTNTAALSYAATPDGRYIVFSSDSTDLVPRDTNETTDIFLHDLATGTTTLVSLASNGGQANGPSNDPILSADGRFVAFDSASDNLVPGDTNGNEDVFVVELPRLTALSGWY